jgi:cysteine desulfurase/selenocysteine lyase
MKISNNETSRSWDSEFALRDGLVYLNHAAVSPWPRRTAEAVRRFAAENAAQGALDYPQWAHIESIVRDQLRRLLNAPSRDDIALLKNTSEGLSLVAYGLPWRPGDNVVAARQEFPSNRIVWESLANRGVELRLADLDGGIDPEDALLALTDRRTRLLTVSSVQYGSGLRMDLEKLGRTCKQRGILFCIDAIQSLGALPFDAQACHADFVAADGHKWLMAPEGIAVFYSNPEAREQLSLCQYGWHMVATPGDFDRHDWEIAGDGRRFECGSPNMLGIHALQASLSLIEEVGIERIAGRVLENTRYLCHALAAIPGIRLLSAASLDRQSGIVTFQVESVIATTVVQRLWARDIITAARGGGIRLSPHFYTPQGDLHTFVETLIQILA